MHSQGEEQLDFSHLEDVLGQIPMVKSYTQVCLCFAMTDETVISDVLQSLEDGLSRLREGFPWLAGQVVIKGKAENSTGLALIKPCETNISLVINDLRGQTEVPDFATLRESRFPMRLLDRKTFAPLPAMPEPFDEIKDAPIRVLQARVNIVKGGILLNMAGCHHAMDMNGLGQVIHLFAKACRAESFTALELESGNRGRKDIIPLFDDTYLPGPELEHMLAKAQPHDAASATTQTSAPGPASDISVTLAPPVSWKYFYFPIQSLNALKTMASAQTQTKYISTDDALTALIWKAIVRVRTARDPTLCDSMMVRGVNIRKNFAMTKEYLGHSVICIYHPRSVPPASVILDIPLPDLTGALRRQLEGEDLILKTRGLATMLNRSADKSVISYAATLQSEKDVLFSSWAKTPCCRSDFGPGLGFAECARRPEFPPLPSLCYFMPRDPDGSIAVAICLRDDDIEALKRDKELMEFAVYVG